MKKIKKLVLVESILAGLIFLTPWISNENIIIENSIKQERDLEALSMPTGTTLVSHLQNINLDDGGEISALLERRYEKFEDVFEKYSKENLPREWDKNDFKALLVAIAQGETSLGYPNGKKFNDNWLMGYDAGGTKPPRWKGAENQIKLSSSKLKKILEKGDVPLYNKCNEKDGESFLRCVLSVYNTGEVYDESSEGKDYADRLYKYWMDWRKNVD